LGNKCELRELHEELACLYHHEADPKETPNQRATGVRYATNLQPQDVDQELNQVSC